MQVGTMDKNEIQDLIKSELQNNLSVKITTEKQEDTIYLSVVVKYNGEEIGYDSTWIYL